MTSVRLNPTHPHFQALEQLAMLADELGISFCVTRMGDMQVVIGGEVYSIRDVEDDGNGSHPTREFPPLFDWKLVQER